ncbi:MAG: permease [Anaerolineaceae bacterium]|nr:permease [Anaerolineaceae bacterium]
MTKSIDISSRVAQPAQPARQARLSFKWAITGIIILILAWMLWSLSLGGWPALFDRLSSFTTIFLSIFIEASPFLLLGSLGSGIVEVFFADQDISRWVPSNALLGAFIGSLMGLFFPVCECGVVPLTRRLIKRGLPVPVGISFLLGAPALNPIVLMSTVVAFGWGPVLWGRVGLTLAIATITGFIFSLQKDPGSLLNQATLDFCAVKPASVLEGGAPGAVRLKDRLKQVLVTTADEFFEIGRFLILGAALASLLQTVVPQASLLGMSQGPVLSVLILILLAVLLSVCSTVDAFIALSFAGSFTTGSILAFLVFGPMVDIKSTVLFLHVFRRKTVVYMILLPLFLTILAAVFINFNLGL